VTQRHTCATCAGGCWLSHLRNRRLKPGEFAREIRLDIAGRDIDDRVITALQPGPPRRAIGGDGFRFVGVDEFDRQPVRKRDEIRNMPADRGLAL